MTDPRRRLRRAAPSAPGRAAGAGRRVGSRPSTSRPTTRCSPTCRRPTAPSTSTSSSSTRPALAALKAAGVKLAVPLVSQGELIGVLNLGPRLSEQDYSSDDRRLLDNLAAQAAPALRVGQLVREQEAEAATRQRFESRARGRAADPAELPARSELPDLAGWQIAALLPARRARSAATSTTSSRSPDGRVAFVIGDVTDKGVPAALVMSATRSVLRASAQRLIEPGVVLERVNEHLCPDMPEKMFVTCLYAVLDPATGQLRFANAGHDLPYVQTRDGVAELRARGHAARPDAGHALRGGRGRRSRRATPCCCTPTGSPRRTRPTATMFGFPRLKETVRAGPPGPS